MLDEIVPVWTKFDPEGLRTWYLARKESQPVMVPADGDTLPEKIIRALAVNDPVAATDFLVNQCKSLEVQVAQGLWSSMEVARDIAAGLSSANQCRRVITLLKSWPRPEDQEIQRLEKAAHSRWSRWDPAGAKAAGSP